MSKRSQKEIETKNTDNETAPSLNLSDEEHSLWLGAIQNEIGVLKTNLLLADIIIERQRQKIAIDTTTIQELIEKVSDLKK